MANITFKGQPVTLPDKHLKQGDQAPDFSLLDNQLNEVSLADYEGKVKLVSVVPSLDTGVCDAQTRRFNEEANNLENVEVITVSMDLPFAQKRWCGDSGLDNVVTLSDHRDGKFGEEYGVLIDEMRLLTRAVFVIDSNNEITYVEYVGEATNHPDYEQAIKAAESAS